MWCLGEMRRLLWMLVAGVPWQLPQRGTCFTATLLLLLYALLLDYYYCFMCLLVTGVPWQLPQRGTCFTATLLLLLYALLLDYYFCFMCLLVAGVPWQLPHRGTFGLCICDMQVLSIFDDIYPVSCGMQCVDEIKKTFWYAYLHECCDVACCDVAHVVGAMTLCHEMFAALFFVRVCHNM